MSQDEDRRTFLGTATSLAMGAGLLASYGTFFGYAGRYLYPAEPGRTAWMFVTDLERMQVGDSLPFRTPAGARILITRQGGGGYSEDFLALSSTCPHLGCQVHWEERNNRFFCPCHNGVFTPQGEGIEGPPKGMALLRYPLKVEGGLLYIQVPVGSVNEARLERPGHDGCLGPL